MSSILKALNKLEQESAALKREPLKIDAEILRGSSPAGISPLKLILAATILFTSGGGATYLYLNPEPMAAQMFRSPESPPTPVSPARHSAIPPKADPVAIEYITPEAQRTVQHYKKNQPTPQKHLSPHQTTAHVQRKELSSAGSKSNRSNKPESAAFSVEPVRIPTLKVNGIAFQDGSDSVAVVNNIPVAKGSLIEGVRVVEILRDRVQFRKGEHAFDILLGKSNR